MSDYRDDFELDHPLFSYCCRGRYPWVFVFEKPLFKTPSEETLEKYRLDRTIVERHGGRMIVQEHELGGRNDPLTREECRVAAEMALELLSSRGFEILEVDTWNGEGFHWLSVGVAAKKRETS